MQHNSYILVIGSANIDMTAYVDHLPRPGETVGNATFSQHNGGKGANQAVAASRAGATVHFVGCVGTDVFGQQVQQALQAEGINTDHLVVHPQHATGIALILVDQQAENSIAVAPGANAALSPNAIDEARFVISGAEYILLQMEIPLDTVAYVLELTAGLGKKVILNAAPASMLEDRLLKGLHMLVVNEQEAALMAACTISTPEDVVECTEKLLQKGIQHVVVTLGSKGAYYATRRAKEWVDAFPVQAVDTTGAGDVFCGALATALHQHHKPAEALKFASAAAALCVTKNGAQTSAPSWEAIRAFLQEHSF